MKVVDLITYVGLVSVAFIEAVNETLKLEPAVAASFPPFLASSIWHFIPLLLLTVVFLTWLAKRFGWIGKKEPAALADNESRTSKEIQVTKAALPQLEPRFGSDAPYKTGHGPIRRSYRLGIYNPGPGIVDNVKVWLRDISPRPGIDFRNNFPYRVPKSGTAWIHNSIDIDDVRINPNEEELFDIAETWVSGDNQLIIAGLDTKSDGNSYRLISQPDEEWHLVYEVTSANASPLKLHFSVIAAQQKVFIVRNA